MTRIHITASGKAAPCTASIRDCPRGGNDDHFDSLKDAVIEMNRRAAAASKAKKEAGPAGPFTDEGMNEHYAAKGERLARGATLLGLRKATPAEAQEQYSNFGRKDADSPYQQTFFSQETYVYEGDLTQELLADPEWRSTLGYWDVSTEEVEAWATHAYGGVGHHFASYSESALEMHPDRTAEDVRNEAIGYLIKRTSFGVRDGAEGTHMAPIPGGTRFNPDGEPLHTKRDAERKAVPVERDSRHLYGGRGEKKEEDAGQQVKQEPKELDPEFILALQNMYIGKFGVHPDGDGVNIGALIAKFNKGELA